MDHTHKIFQAHNSIHNTEIILVTKSTTNKHCLVKKNINAAHAIIWWRDDTPSLSCFVLSNLLTSSVKSRCRFIKTKDLRIAEESCHSLTCKTPTLSHMYACQFAVGRNHKYSTVYAIPIMTLYNYYNNIVRASISPSHILSITS